MGYDPSTGLTTGSVWDTDDYITRSWWNDADTVVTVKTTGGDFLLSELQLAVDAAATRNDKTVIVIDSGVTITPARVIMKRKATAPRGWTLICCSNWWDGTWNPSRTRTSPFLWVNEETSNLVTLRQDDASTLPVIDCPNISDGGGATTSQGANRYVWIGMHIGRANGVGGTVARGALVLTRSIPENTLTSVDDLAREHIIAWSWIDGVWKNGANYYPTNRGWIVSSTHAAMLHCAVTGMIGNGDTGAVGTTLGRYIKMNHNLIECTAQPILTGGGNQTSVFETCLDIEARFNYCVVRQEVNHLSSLYDFTCPSPNNKMGLETKVGRRILFEGNVLKNRFGNVTSAGVGTAILLKCANQYTSNDPHYASDISVRLNKLIDQGQALGILALNLGGDCDVTQELWDKQEPMARVEFVGNLTMTAPVGENQLTVPTAISFASSGDLGKNDPADRIAPCNILEVYLGAYMITRPRGPIRVEWNTLGSRNPEGWQQLNIMSYFIRPDVDPPLLLAGYTLKNNVFDVSREYGVSSLKRATPTSNDSTVRGAPAMVELGATVSHNAWAESPTGRGLIRSEFEAAYPDQFNPPGLWSLYGSATIPRPRPAEWFVDPANGDFRPHPNASYRGLGEGGRDPGAPHDLIDTVTAFADPAKVPSFITLDFVP